MKKLILAPYLILTCSVFGQDNLAVTEDLRVRKVISKMEFLVGASYVRPSGGVYLDNQQATKIGLTAAVGLIHNFNSSWALNTKFLYEEKGFRRESSQLNEDYNPSATQRVVTDLTFKYATVSILPRYYIGKVKQFYVSAGPHVSYLLGEKILYEIYINDVLTSKTGSNGSSSLNYEEFDFGLTTLAGYDFRLGVKLGGTIQFAYNLGLIDVAQPDISKLRNITYTLLLGVHLSR